MPRKVIYSITGAIIIIVIGFSIVWILGGIPQGWDWVGTIQYTFYVIIFGGGLGAVVGYKLAERVNKREDESKKSTPKNKIWILIVVIVAAIIVGIVLWVFNSNTGGTVYCIPNHGCFHGSRGIIY